MLGETETNPIRRFISYRDQVAYNTLDHLLVKVGERDFKIQGGLTPEEPSFEHSDLFRSSLKTTKSLRMCCTDGRLPLLSNTAALLGRAAVMAGFLGERGKNPFPLTSRIL